jgi:hypothetical protein
MAGRATRARRGERPTLRVKARPVPVLFATEKLAAQGEILNLRRQGVFIRALDLPAPGEPLCITFKNRQRKKIQLGGEVRWTTAQLEGGNSGAPGFGMMFTGRNDAYRDLFKELLRLSFATDS